MIPMRPKELLTALVSGGVDFVLVGGLAAAIHGTTRITRDIDITYATNAENLERLCAVLNRFEPRHIILGKPEGGVVALTPAILQRERILQLATFVGEVDLLGSIHGFKSYAFVKQNAELQDVGVKAPVLSIAGLLRAKRAMKRPKDQQDIVELEALAEARDFAQDAGGASIKLRGPQS